MSVQFNSYLSVSVDVALDVLIKHVPSARWQNKLFLFEWFAELLDTNEFGFNDELRHTWSQAEKAWDLANKYLLGGSDIEWYAWDAIADSIFPREYAARENELLSRLSSTIESCWDESEYREYKYGDSDYNPTSRSNRRSWAEDSCGHELPAYWTGHRYVKRTQYNISEPEVTVYAATYDEDIPF